MRFAVNVAFLFTELGELDRFEAAAQAGFRAVELPWPTQDLDEVAAAIQASGLELVQLNADAGDLAAGDRGYANDPSRVEEWRDAVERALAWGFGLGRPACNLLVGNRLDDVDLAIQRRTVHDNLRWACQRAEQRDAQLLVEVLNHVDTPRYLCTRLDAARALLEAVGHPLLGLQFDTYHVATVHGPLVPALRSVADLVAHVQVADAPGRHEPGTGRSDLTGILQELGASGYDGVISLEYVPSTTTLESLAWLPVEQRSAPVVDVGALPLE